MGSPNYDRLVGQGKAGLGKNELKRRVKQHNALAEKAFASVKGKEQLTAADVSNIYRGIGLKNDAKLMQSIGDKTYSFPKSNNQKTILGYTKDEWSAGWDATKKSYVDTAKKYLSNLKNLNSSPTLPVWEDRNKKNKNTKL
jgi:hypothetical protein